MARSRYPARGRHRGSVDFSAGGRINGPANLVLSDSCTVIGWSYNTSVSANYTLSSIENPSAPTTYRGFGGAISDAHLYINSATFTAAAVTTLVANTWYAWAYTCTTVATVGYVLQPWGLSTVSIGGSAHVAGEFLGIGDDPPTDSSGAFPGYIAYVKAWQYAMSEAEVMAEFRQGAPVHKNQLAVYLPLDNLARYTIDEYNPGNAWSIGTAGGVQSPVPPPVPEVLSKKAFSFIVPPSAVTPFGYANDEARPAHRSRDFPAARLAALHEMSAWSKTKPLGNTAIMQDDAPPQQAPKYIQAYRASVLEWSGYDVTKPLGNTAILQDHAERSSPRAWPLASMQAVHEWSAFSTTKPLGNTAILQDHSERSQPRAWRLAGTQVPHEAIPAVDTKPLRNTAILQDDALPQKPTLFRRAGLEVPHEWSAYDATTAQVTLGPFAPLQDDAQRQQPRAYRGAALQAPNEATGFDVTKPLGNTAILQDDAVRQQAPRYPWPDRLAAQEALAELQDTHPLPTPVPLQDDSVRQRAPQYLGAYRSATNDALAELPDAHPLSNAILQEDPLPHWRRAAQPQEWIAYDPTKPLGNTALLQDDEPPQRAAPVPRSRPLTTVQPEQVFDILNLVLLPTIGGWAVDDARGRWRRPRDTEEIGTVSDTKPLGNTAILQDDALPRRRRPGLPEDQVLLEHTGLPTLPMPDENRRLTVRMRVAPEEMLVEARRSVSPVFPDDGMPVPVRVRARAYDDAPLKDVHVVILPSLGWVEDEVPRPRYRGTRPVEEPPWGLRGFAKVGPVLSVLREILVTGVSVREIVVTGIHLGEILVTGVSVREIVVTGVHLGETLATAIVLREE